MVPGSYNHQAQSKKEWCIFHLSQSQAPKIKGASEKHSEITTAKIKLDLAANPYRQRIAKPTIPKTAIGVSKSNIISIGSVRLLPSKNPPQKCHTQTAYNIAAATSGKIRSQHPMFANIRP